MVMSYGSSIYPYDNLLGQGFKKEQQILGRYVCSLGGF